MSSPIEHVRTCMARADAAADAIAIAFLARRDEASVADAQTVDPSLPLAGEVLAVKACYDVAGWVTHAGSAVLADEAPATTDAPIVASLRAAGAILFAQTNMTEFAYGALGLNRTFGTPTTPLRAADVRVAGGSTSGGAVAVALGAADIALGSDTSGSIRIPAAFCGVAGFKPSQDRYPSSGMIPLAASFDAPGFIARDASLLARIDSTLSDDRTDAHSAGPLHGVRLLVPVDAIYDGATDDEVLDRFARWCDALSGAGAQLIGIDMPMLTEASLAARAGSVIAVEAYDWHRDLIAERFDRYDPRVGTRIQHGAGVLASDYVAALRTIHRCRSLYDDVLRDAAAIITPTVPILPPRVADVQTTDAYLSMNTEVLRLTEFANRLDLPSISLPGNPDSGEPIGLMLTGRRRGDAALFDLALAVEACIASV